MEMYRDTYAKIYLNNIKNNVKKIINFYNNYEYYFGVVKADCYGHCDLAVVNSIIDGGCNYLAVAMLEEALEIRKENKNIPILCLGVISLEDLNVCVENNITITINSYEYAKELVNKKINNLKVHIKINSGMNRLGINNKDEVNNTYLLLKNNKIEVEGIYTHIYNASDVKDTNEQFIKYEELIKDINKDEVKIFHIAASETLTNYNKISFVNGCRLGIIMYGFTDNKDLCLEDTFSLHSKVIQINELHKGEKLGYGGRYIAKGDEKIAVVCIGYADGVIRKNTGRYVYINDNKYLIVGNICMDMLFVKVDEKVNVNDDVVILKDVEHIREVANYLDTIPYEVLCTISKRVPRIYN